MHQPSVCIISVYFGPLSDWIGLWLRSLQLNSSVDFLLVTDQDISVDRIENLRVLHMTLPEFRQLAQERLGARHISLKSPYKLCDFKPVWGVILADYVTGYDYWGECDNDLIFGDLRAFFTRYDLARYIMGQLSRPL